MCWMRHAWGCDRVSTPQPRIFSRLLRAGREEGGVRWEFRGGAGGKEGREGSWRLSSTTIPRFVDGFAGAGKWRERAWVVASICTYAGKFEALVGGGATYHIRYECHCFDSSSRSPYMRNTNLGVEGGRKNGRACLGYYFYVSAPLPIPKVHCARSRSIMYAEEPSAFSPRWRR